MGFIFYANFVVNGEPTGLKVLYDSRHPTKDAILISPKAKLEINKAYAAEFSMPPSHYLYNRMTRFTTLIYIVYCDRLIFRGRVIDIKPDFEMKKQISCESDINFLLDNIVYPKDYTAGGFIKLFYNTDESVPMEFGLLQAYNDGYSRDPAIEGWGGVENYKKFDIGNVTVAYDGVYPDHGTIDINQRDKTDSLGDIIRNELINVYGGIITTRTEDFGTPFERHYIDYLADPFQAGENGTPVNTQGIKFGINMINFDYGTDVNEVFSRLIPLNSDGRPISIQGRTYISVPELEAAYGIIYKAVKFEKGTYYNATVREAQKYIQRHGKILPAGISVKALDFKVFDGNVDEIKLGEKILAYSEPHGLDEILYCSSIEYDFLNPEETTYNIGPFIPSYDGKTKNSSGTGRYMLGGTGDPVTQTTTVLQSDMAKYANVARYSSINEAMRDAGNSTVQLVSIVDADGNRWDTFAIKA